MNVRIEKGVLLSKARCISRDSLKTAFEGTFTRLYSFLPAHTKRFQSR